MEEWRDIKDYEQLYQISSMGRVKSLKFGKEKILKSSKTKNGYLIVCFSKDGVKTAHRIHRLVASAFLPNHDNLPEINHKDENKTNNMVDNLEWCDRSYNNNFGTHNERVSKANSIPILQFNKTGEFIRSWESATQVERELGISQSNITKCCKGRYKSTGGYVWGYAENYERIPFKVFDLEMYEKKKVA